MIDGGGPVRVSVYYVLSGSYKHPVCRLASIVCVSITQSLRVVTARVCYVFSCNIVERRDLCNVLIPEDVVSTAAVLSLVTQRYLSHDEGALRDQAKHGCGGNYRRRERPSI